MIAEATAQILVQIHSRLTPFPLLFSDISGIYHLTAGGQTSWYGFAKAILHHRYSSAASVPRLKPIGTAEYPTPAKRPKNSVMSNAKLNHKFGLIMPDWEISLRLCSESST
jgi:dTDP-4-dehydrorhamnose reductase